MKIDKVIVVFSVVVLAALSAEAQGTFQNLDFEQANPVSVVGSPYYPYAVTVANALPDWTVSYGTAQQTQILYNDPSAGSTAVMLTGPAFYPGFAPIDGNYSVVLEAGGNGPAASISQTGFIPDLTQSLLFEAEPAVGETPGPLEVLVGTQIVPLTTVGAGPNYTLYGANISAWAGQTEEITLSALEGQGLKYTIIDDISFSPMAVPEPGIVALTAMGGLLFGVRKWIARRSS